MLFLKKYLLFAFLIENIMAQTSLMGPLANPMFYTFLTLGLVCAMDGQIWNHTAIKEFGWAYALMGLYLFYEFFIGIEYINQKTLLYVLAKITTFVIIISGVYYNESFYRGKAIKWLTLTMSFFLLYGLASGGFADSTGRMLAGYSNANTAGSMGAVIVGMTVFYTRGRKWHLWAAICVFAGMFGVLASGSRAGFLMLGLLVFLRYGINLKTIGMYAAIIILGLFLLPAIGIETVGIQRMFDTYNGTEGTNRDVEREAAEWMISQKPLIGWGYKAQNQGYALKLSMLGAHNGYLETIKQMGYPCAILYFAIVLSTILRGLSLQRKAKMKMTLFLAVVLMYLVKANYESLFVGVHEFGTNLFFFSLAIVSASSYRLASKK